MEILLLNGAPREKGNTNALIEACRMALEAAEKAGKQ